MKNFIIINAVVGARGHQLGRLLASCDNVLWYDHFKNGSQPWLPSMGLGDTVSKYHWTRRFEGAIGIGVDSFTVPAVLERAESNKQDPYPMDLLKEWSDKVSPNYLMLVLHDSLEKTKQLFPDAIHFIINPRDIDAIVDRLKIVGADYRWSTKPYKTMREAFTNEKPFEENIKPHIIDILNSYKNAEISDTVVESVDELLDPNKFLEVCNKYNLKFNIDNFLKTAEFVRGDNAPPKFEVRQIFNRHRPHVEKFLKKCSDLNYKNNVSLESIKWDWCLKEGSWWATYNSNNEIISISGMHPFKDGYRTLFRGAQTETRLVKGLNRYQFQSWPMYAHLPMQIEWARWQGKDKIYITTNVINDASGRMNRIHNSFAPLHKAGVVDYLGDEEIFFTQQSVWLVNIEKYFEKRKIHEY